MQSQDHARVKLKIWENPEDTRKLTYENKRKDNHERSTLEGRRKAIGKAAEVNLLKRRKRDAEDLLVSKVFRRTTDVNLL